MTVNKKNSVFGFRIFTIIYWLHVNLLNNVHSLPGSWISPTLDRPWGNGNVSDRESWPIVVSTREHVALQTTDDLPRKVGARSDSRVGLGMSQFRFPTLASLGAWLQLLLNYYWFLIEWSYMLGFFIINNTEKKRRRNLTIHIILN